MWHQTKFSSLLSSTRILITDEAHVYSGIFGTNVHYIIKRLKRICTNKLQFVAASATLDDAKEFCQKLFGEKMQKFKVQVKKENRFCNAFSITSNTESPDGRADKETNSKKSQNNGF